LPPGAGVPVRVHGAYVSDGELKRVIADWKQRGEPEYVEEVLQDEIEQSG
jgi:S-DNA-T family DNA segregation ATPase FtsK/SpoIIIE